MDIDLLSKMVKELILDNERVVLPGLGSFVAEIVPATFSDKGYTINPPYRKLYFRSKPDEGSDLIPFYAKSNSVSEEIAEKVIVDFISELKTILFHRKTVIFPGLGRLRATKENNVFFVADEDLDIYPEGFGLEPISLKTHQATTSEVKAAVSDLKSILTEPVEEIVEPVVTEVVEVMEPALEVAPEIATEVVPEVTVEVAVEETLEVPSEPEDVAAVVEEVLEPESEPEQDEVASEPEEVAESEPEVVEFTDEVEALPMEEEQQPEVQQPEEEEPIVPQPIEEELPVEVELQKEIELPTAELIDDEIDEKEDEPVETKVEPAKKPLWKALLKVLTWIVVAVVVLTVAYVAVSHLCPQWIDQFLYTPEELELLNNVYE